MTPHFERLLLIIAVVWLGPLSMVLAQSRLEVRGAWSRATPPGAPAGAAYFQIVAHGGGGDRLVGVSSPVAERAQLHTTRIEGGIMKMLSLADVAVGPGATVAFEPGGKHVMLMGLKQDLSAGDRFGMTLEFERAGAVEIEVEVRGLDGAGRAGRAGRGAAHHGAGHDSGQAHSRMHGHGGHHTGHTVVDVDDPGKAPALFLRVLPDAVDGWNLHLQTRNFRFAPERVNTPDVMGEGHAHVYVDGKKVARVYGEWFHLSGLAPGRHEIRVTLNANRHGHYAVGGAPVQAAVGIQQR